MSTLPSGPAGAERQVTTEPHGHVLTNCNVWSHDSQWIVYDVRSDAAGERFDGSRIERVHVDTGEVQILYESTRGAHCGVVTASPVDDRVVFIHGPENPSPDWQYAANHRHGVIVDARSRAAVNLDARDLTPPFTPGALRGGSHVHVFSGDGRWVSFTYEDAVLARFNEETLDHEVNLRGVGVSVAGRPVHVKRADPRNHDGSHFSVLVTDLHANPDAGSDQVSRAFEDAWVGTGGYLRPDGSRQERAIAFQGHVRTDVGHTIAEVFIVDLPDDLTVPGDGPLEGTTTRRPRPPRGVVQRRLTWTAGRRFPGIQGPRHWLRSSPDGSRIAFLMKDDRGVAQLWTVSPNGGEPTQVTDNPWPVASAFTWGPNGRFVAHVMDGSVFRTEIASGRCTRLTPKHDAETEPRPEACVVSPDSRRVAYVRSVANGNQRFNQVFIIDVGGGGR